MQWDGSFASTASIIEWGRRHGSEIDFTVDPDSEKYKLYELLIPTLEGTMHASVGDYIAKGINDEFWPIKPDIMSKTYEEVV